MRFLSDFGVRGVATCVDGMLASRFEYSPRKNVWGTLLKDLFVFPVVVRMSVMRNGRCPAL